MRLTVAICTWNRCQLLRETLAHLTMVDVPATVDWELIVVNNNSTDGTDGVIAEFASRLPLRRVGQPIPGLSNARNAAIAESTGDYIIWTDDDVHVRRDWIAAYAREFEAHPDGVVFGGTIRPWFEGDPPYWLTVGVRSVPDIGGSFALLEARPTGTLITLDNPLTLPFGANFALRRAEQAAHLYDPTLGRRENKMTSGEETDVIIAVLRGGGLGYWVADAVVDHFIPAVRQRLSYVRRYFRASGETSALMENDRSPQLFGVPRWVLRSAVEHEIRYQLGRTRTPTGPWLQSLVSASIAQGHLIGRANRRRK